MECDDATLLCREWPVFDVTLPFPVPLATGSDRPESASSGISFIESGLSSAGSEFSTFVIDDDAVVIVADDGFGLTDALLPLSR